MSLLNIVLPFLGSFRIGDCFGGDYYTKNGFTKYYNIIGGFNVEKVLLGKNQITYLHS